MGNAGGQLLARRLQSCLDAMAALAERLLTYAELNDTTAQELRAEPHCQHLVCPGFVRSRVRVIMLISFRASENPLSGLICPRAGFSRGFILYLR